jgi:class 3 adenylate cyclase
VSAQTAQVKYVFLDIVKFTEGRSVEAQSDIVASINSIVAAAVKTFAVSEDRLIFLPTGDGLCVALIDVDEPFDVHLGIATAILGFLAEHNEGQKDVSRKFDVRIGVNANLDNLVEDINGRRNIAGAGINLAARIMSVADGNQILVGQSVYDVLRYREKYMKLFRGYTATVKHNVNIPVYQLTSALPGLNTKPPMVFTPKPSVEKKFEKVVGYYLALAFRFREFLPADDSMGSLLWLWYAANDLEENEHRYPDSKPSFKTYGASQGIPVDKQIAYYCSLEFHVKWDLGEYVAQKWLDPFYGLFERGQYGMMWHWPSAEARDKLIREWPDIAKRLEVAAA